MTLIRIPILDTSFDMIGGAINIPADQIKGITVFLTWALVCYAFRFIKETNKRHFFSIFTGLLLQFFMYREGTLLFLILVATNFILMRALTREKLPEWMFTYNMVFLSAVHIYYMITAFGDWTLNPTTFMMPLVCRLSSL